MQGDVQGLQTADERTEGAHLPQEAEMEVPPLQSHSDAGE
jgi:hypothetical protein